MNKQLIPNRVYHIYNHATGEDNFFRSEENYRYFLQKYQQHINPVAQTYAYCLMPNHFHFMIRIRSEELLNKLHLKSLRFQMPVKSSDVQLNSMAIENEGNSEGLPANFVSQRFSNFFNGYSKAFNKMYDRRGTLFRERFGRKLIDSDGYFTRLVRYIHHNPVNHGFVRKMIDWKWSSYHAYKAEVATEEVLDWFGGLDKFIEFHEEYKYEFVDENIFD